MSRVIINLPTHFNFKTEIPVMASHINSSNHVGNDSLATIINEARIRYFQSLSFNELDQASGLSLVAADLAVIYLSEARYGETMIVEAITDNYHRCGFDVFYQVSSKSCGRRVAKAKTAHILMNTKTGKSQTAPKAHFDAVKAG